MNAQFRPALHAISPFRKRLDNELLVLISPAPHILVRVNDRPHKAGNILSLTTLFMERYGVRWRCQGLQGNLDVELGSTRNTKVQTWEVQLDQFLYKTEDVVSC